VAKPVIILGSKKWKNWLCETLQRVEDKIDSVLQKETQMANTLDSVLADVQTETTLIGSLSTLTSGLKAQLDAVLAGNLTAAQQAQVDAIFAAVESNKQAVTDAITANTSAAPTP
jgi:molybdopterin-guanine dinucleotide biosynthesis protein A